MVRTSARSDVSFEFSKQSITNCCIYSSPVADYLVVVTRLYQFVTMCEHGQNVTNIPMDVCTRDSPPLEILTMIALISTVLCHTKLLCHPLYCSLETIAEAHLNVPIPWSCMVCANNDPKVSATVKVPLSFQWHCKGFQHYYQGSTIKVSTTIKVSITIKVTANITKQEAKVTLSRLHPQLKASMHPQQKICMQPYGRKSFFPQPLGMR